MRKSVKLNNDQVIRQHRTSPLCWAARLLALGYGLLIALYVLGTWILVLMGKTSRGQTAEAMTDLAGWLPFFIPLVLAVVAWRWHLVGGTLITAGSAGLYLYLLLVGNMQWGVHLYVLPLLAGGLLHLLAWHKEKRADQMTQPT